VARETGVYDFIQRKRSFSIRKNRGKTIKGGEYERKKETKKNGGGGKRVEGSDEKKGNRYVKLPKGDC